MLFPKRGSRTSSPYRKSLLRVTDFSWNRIARKRSSGKFKELFSEMDDESLVDEQALQDYPTSMNPHVFHKFLFVIAHTSQDIYEVFLFEPRQQLASGQSKMLEEFFKHRLDQHWTLLSVKHQYGSPKAFSVIRQTILKSWMVYWKRWRVDCHTEAHNAFSAEKHPVNVLASLWTLRSSTYFDLPSVGN